MKILVISHPCVTPINQQFYAEIEKQTDWEITIVVPSNWKSEYGGKAIALERWPEYTGELLTIPTWMSGNIPLHLYRSTFTQLLKEISPDAIYVNHEPYGLATAQIYLANILSINRPIGFFTWQNIFKQYPFPFQQLQQFVFERSHFAFPGSQSAKEILREKGYDGPCTLLPGAIDPEIYFPRPESADLKVKLKDSEDEILIGYMGRIVEEKGFATLACALNIIRALPWRLIVVGTGDYQDEFSSQMNSLGLGDRVNYLGYVPHPEAPIYLSIFDLLVIPSETRANWKEQFGRVIIEAMACLTPVVGSNSGEIPNLIRATGGGLVFEEGNSEALAEQLSLLILDDSLREQTAATGRQTVLAQYNTTAIARQFINEINRVVQSPS
ncbi:glycosyl transferase, group 1 family protein [Synechococcus sp. PCC 7335]|uniref:glycosyltransferase n=1 Tax=Synechococcus sp. (strain ATCC 29403 / PCC 7335) TaxID=91464 RepID=UPI00017EB40E|nr:glycosyltransferase [Synechococcus sp. PCC 7335]EDX85492.1 glycosyl transferase, group 1 family protein [Synechococcus sp. PCC 7335]